MIFRAKEETLTLWQLARVRETCNIDSKLLKIDIQAFVNKRKRLKKETSPRRWNLYCRWSVNPEKHDILTDHSSQRNMGNGASDLKLIWKTCREDEEKEKETRAGRWFYTPPWLGSTCTSKRLIAWYVHRSFLRAIYNLLFIQQQASSCATWYQNIHFATLQRHILHHHPRPLPPHRQNHIP